MAITSGRFDRRFAFVGGLIVFALVGVVVLLALARVQKGSASAAVSSDLFHLPAVLVLAITGGLIVARRPNNRIGVGLCLAALAAALLGAAKAYVQFGLLTPGSLPLVDVAAWVYSWLWVWVLVPPITLLLLVCPDGRLPSRRWWPAVAIDLVALLLLSVSQMLKAGPFEDFPGILNPFGWAAIDPLLVTSNWVGFLLLPPAIAISVAALIGRFRRSHGSERQQLKWLAYAAVGALLLYVFSWAIALATPLDVWGFSTVLAICLFPVATCIAILRHNLYDIDRLINRTLVYGLLSAGLAILYFVLVVGFQNVFRPLGEDSDLAVALTTLILAAVFLPARRHVQRAVDRRFNRRLFNASVAIDSFGSRLRTDIDLESLGDEVFAVVRITMEPAKISLWMRASDRVKPTRSPAQWR